MKGLMKNSLVGIGAQASRNRVLCCAFALSSLCISNAQVFELSASSGATLEGNTFHVTAGSSFTVDVWLRGLPQALTVNTYFLSLAHDRTNGIGTTATRLDNKLTVSGFANLYSAMDVVLAAGTNRGSASTTGAGGNYGFITGAARPYVSWSAMAAPVGTTVTLAPGDTLFARYMVNVAGMAVGETYGDDPTEAGLFIANQGGLGAPTLGGSGLVGTPSENSRRIGSQLKYAVTVVPEPGSMAVLGLGIIAAFRQRRKGDLTSGSKTNLKR